MGGVEHVLDLRLLRHALNSAVHSSYESESDGGISRLALREYNMSSP